MRCSPSLPALVFSGLLALGVGVAGAAPTCEGLTVTGDGSRLFEDGFESGGLGRWGDAPAGPVFHGSDTLEVRFELALGGDLSGEHRVELRVRMPDGFSYQSLDVPVAAAPPAAAAARPGRSPSRAGAATTATPRRRLPGYPDPLPLQAVAVAASGSAIGPVTGAIAVGGTQITTGSLYGAWTVDAFLDGAEDPCASASFEIRP